MTLFVKEIDETSFDEKTYLDMIPVAVPYLNKVLTNIISALSSHFP
jgi:hypothetical protein